MNSRTIRGPKGKIKCIEVTTTGAVIKDESDESISMCRCPALLTIAQLELISDEPILSISVEDMTIILDFNSDFPLLFAEGIKIWK